jgi:hypothetical protein
MIAIAKPSRSKKSQPAWHEGFLAMLPAIERHAKIAFRHLDAEAREEMVQEVICNACRAYARLAELNKTDVAYPGALARFGVVQARSGRRTGGKLNCRDILSSYCQQKKHLAVERLDRRDEEDGSWTEILVEDRRAGPSAGAAMRMDFADWLQILPRHLRKMATFLANGETTTAAAKRFRRSAGRISQVRRQLYEAWHEFQGDMPVIGTA